VFVEAGLPDGGEGGAEVSAIRVGVALGEKGFRLSTDGRSGRARRGAVSGSLGSLGRILSRRLYDRLDLGLYAPAHTGVRARSQSVVGQTLIFSYLLFSVPLRGVAWRCICVALRFVGVAGVAFSGAALARTLRRRAGSLLALALRLALVPACEPVAVKGFALHRFANRRDGYGLHVETGGGVFVIPVLQRSALGGGAGVREHQDEDG
jgi:hypothetical protein